VAVAVLVSGAELVVRVLVSGAELVRVALLAIRAILAGVLFAIGRLEIGCERVAGEAWCATGAGVTVRPWLMSVDRGPSSSLDRPLSPALVWEESL